MPRPFSRSLVSLLVLLLAAFPAQAAAPLVVTEGPGTIAVQTTDWKVVFDAAFNGGPSQWYDLGHDPGELDNLACSHDGQYSQGTLFDYDVYLGTSGSNAIEFMTTMGRSADPGSLEMTLLESTPARVRIRQKGHPRLNNGGGPAGNPFPELPLISFTTLWTIYPSGRVNVDFTTEVDPAGMTVDSGPGGAGRSIQASGTVVDATGGTDFRASGVWAGDTIESASGGWGPVQVTSRTSATTLQLAQSVPSGSSLDFVVRRSNIVMETISIHADGDDTIANQCVDPGVSHWQGGSNGDPLWDLDGGGGCAGFVRNTFIALPPLANDTLLAHWTRPPRTAGSLLVFREPWAGVGFGAFNDRSFLDISYTQLGIFGVRPATGQHRHFLAQLGSAVAPSLPRIRSIADATPYAADYRAPAMEVLEGSAASGADIDAQGFDLATGAYGVTAAPCSPTGTCRVATVLFDGGAAGRGGAAYREPAIELAGFDAPPGAGDTDLRVDVSSDAGATWTALDPSLFHLSSASDEASLGAGRRVFQYLGILSGSGSSAPALRFRAASQCTPSPRAGCRSAQRNAIDLVAGSTPSTRSLRWRWQKGDATAVSDFGDPRAQTDTSVCVYAGSPAALVLEASVAPGENAAGSPWRGGRSGFAYANREGNADGITSLRLGAGAAGSAKIQVKGRGAGLTSAPLPFDEGADVVVQLATDDGGACWQGVFPASTAAVNTTERFQATAP